MTNRSPLIAKLKNSWRFSDAIGLSVHRTKGCWWRTVGFLRLSNPPRPTLSAREVLLELSAELCGWDQQEQDLKFCQGPTVFNLQTGLLTNCNIVPLV